MLLKNVKWGISGLSNDAHLQQGGDYAVSAPSSRIARTDMSKSQRYGEQHGGREGEEDELIHQQDSPHLQRQQRGYLVFYKNRLKSR